MAARRTTAADKLIRARTQLLLNQPFFGTLCVRLKLVPDAAFPTMAPTGQCVVYNPEFVEKLTAAELEAVLAHEVLHCALAHHCRRGTRKPDRWNEACDYAVNPILIENGMTLPAGVLVNPAFAGLGAEEIYARLREECESETDSQRQPDSQGGSSGHGANAPHDSGREQLGNRPGGFGEVLDATDDDGAPACQAETS